MEEQNIQKSIKFLKSELDKLVDGQLDMLDNNKSLKSYYKNPESAHKVLHRIGERELGA